MASYTTLVNVDAETAHKLTLFVSQLLPSAEGQQFYNESKSLIDSVKTAELINKILEQSKYILAIDDETGKLFVKKTILYLFILHFFTAVDGCFQSLFAVIYTLGDDNNELSIVKSVVSSLTSDNSQSRLRLKELISLFNLAFSGESKYEVMNGNFIHHFFGCLDLTISFFSHF
jgi:hypothetical protein